MAAVIINSIKERFRRRKILTRRSTALMLWSHLCFISFSFCIMAIHLPVPFLLQFLHRK